MNLFGLKKGNPSLKNINSLDILDDKISYYLEWCRKNNVEHDVKDIKSIIDKVTVWYELRYPDSYLDQEDVDQVMFGNTDNINVQNWGDFYNFDKFYYSLSKKEKSMLNIPIFADMIYLNNGRSHIHFNEDGSISDASDVYLFDRTKANGVYDAGSLLDGKSIDEWPKIMKEAGISADYLRINSIINNYKKRVNAREYLFDSIMFNLIERGGKYYGPRRGVLFAREFERDIKVPVSYGDSSLALEYLANDGDDTLMCYVDYFDGNLEKKSINDILSNQNLIGMQGKQKKKVFPKSCE